MTFFRTICTTVFWFLRSEAISTCTYQGLPQWLNGEDPCAIQEMGIQSLGQEDTLEEGMTVHSNILAWRIPWTGKPGGLQSMGSERVRYD